MGVLKSGRGALCRGVCAQSECGGTLLRVQNPFSPLCEKQRFFSMCTPGDLELCVFDNEFRVDDA